jgi:nucleoside-diphosphate-sugar epimerase
MRIVIIGGTGHIGTYLVPRLVEAGHDLLIVSRGERKPYQTSRHWESIQHIPLDREREEANGTFGWRILDLKPEVVIDLICFTVESCRQLVEALRGNVRHFLHCGTIWVYGHTGSIPATEEAIRSPLDQYGTNKAGIENYLIGESRKNDFPATILHPGHIVGAGWVPVNPAGNLNVRVFASLALGEQVTLPNLGYETLHHVHADDVAQAFAKSIAHWSTSVGEVFNVVSPQALSLRRYAERVANHYGREPDLAFLPWAEWKATVSEQDADLTWDHIRHSPCCSIAKAQQLLEYHPRYSSLQAVFEALGWLENEGRLYRQ